LTIATVPPKEESAVLSDIAGTARDVKATPATEEFSEPINTTSVVSSTTGGTQNTEETTMPGAPVGIPATGRSPYRRRARHYTGNPAGRRRSRRPFRSWPRSSPSVPRGTGVFRGAGGERENHYSRSMENQYGQGQHSASNLGYNYGPSNYQHFGYGADSFSAIDPSYASYNGTSMVFQSRSRNLNRGGARRRNRGNPNRGDNSSSGRSHRPPRGFENRWNS
jgi:hypothetical protein